MKLVDEAARELSQLVSLTREARELAERSKLANILNGKEHKIEVVEMAVTVTLFDVVRFARQITVKYDT